MHAHAVGLTRAGITLCVVGALAAPAWSFESQHLSPSAVENAPAAGIQELLEFDLPAQPLAAALDRYGAVSKQSVMFIDALVAGKSSAPVHGRFTPLAALNGLLAGTGLVADDVSTQRQGAFVLKPAAPGTPGAVVARLDRGYDGQVQTHVWRALCADPRTAPGHYRAILQVQVMPSGRLHRAKLIASTGDGGRDGALLAALAQLQMDRPPPPDLEQPLTLVILPDDVLSGPGCPLAVH